MGSPKTIRWEGVSEPDWMGYFGPYGGRFVPETLVPALEELEKAFVVSRRDKTFRSEYHRYLSEYAGRPTPRT